MQGSPGFWWFGAWCSPQLPSRRFGVPRYLPAATRTLAGRSHGPWEGGLISGAAASSLKSSSLDPEGVPFACGPLGPAGGKLGPTSGRPAGLPCGLDPWVSVVGRGGPQVARYQKGCRQQKRDHARSGFSTLSRALQSRDDDGQWPRVCRLSQHFEHVSFRTA